MGGLPNRRTGNSGAAARDLDRPTSPSKVGTVLVIGNGMVSHRLCDQLTRVRPKTGPDAGMEEGAAPPKIVVLGEENRPAYDRMRLGEMLRGRRATSLSLASPDWYRERDIELVLDDPVVSVDRKARVARTRSGRAFPYDHLVFATGAAPVVPSIDLDVKADVFVIRTTRDLERLRDRAQGTRSVAVMGGGLLGLETAKSLREAGLEVTVVESSPQLMARQLDEEAADVLKAKLEGTGIAIILGSAVKRIAPTPAAVAGSAGDPALSSPGRPQQLIFAPEAGRAPLEVDFVVLSVGVHPRDELAKACGLTLGKRGGIAIDKHLRTSDPSVYAIGDCAALEDVSFGLVAPGYRMAEALAATLLGTPTAFEVSTAPVKLKVAGVDVVSMGETRARPSHKSYRFRHKSVYRRVVVENGHIVGATSVGGWPELGAVQEAITAERELTHSWYDRFNRGETLFRPSAAGVERPDEDVVCVCASVTAGTIRRAIANGCKTADAVSNETGASRGCGSCLPLVTLMVGGRPAGLRPAPRRWLATFSAATLVGLALALIASPAKLATILEQLQLDLLVRDPFWQQVSGFTLLGCCALAMVLPLVKRALRVSGSTLPVWRTVHTGVGLAALVALVAHTSLRRGFHLNLALEASFALLLLLGAGAGLFGLKAGGAVGGALRLAHLIVFWPLLSLIGLHVLAVYYF